MVTSFAPARRLFSSPVILMILMHWLPGSTKSKPSPSNPLQLSLGNSDNLRTDPASIEMASKDFGHTVKKIPVAVFYPSSVADIKALIQLSYNSSQPFSIAARGEGHSVSGQAMAQNGIVVNMKSLKSEIKVSGNPCSGYFVDVGGERLWIDVLNATLKRGLSPVSWTDYLYLTVGGTLSNAGISGQTFLHGPQISNVLELDVVTGKGDFVTCSRERNPDLFFGVLGGLGQFGIITRARIVLKPAPTRVKWIRMLYHDFSSFTRDQESLISIHKMKGKSSPDYVEGMLIFNNSSPNNWRSSFFPLSDQPRISSLVTHYGIIYCLEVVKYYDNATKGTIDKELERVLKGLSFIPGTKYQKDTSYVEFLDRVHHGEVQLRSKGLWDVPHPWLNLFIAKSGISNFERGVFRGIVPRRNLSIKGPVLVYPVGSRSMWDDRMSAVVTDEDIIYTVGFLYSGKVDDWKSHEEQNKEVMEFCEKSGIKMKQYLPHYTSTQGWKSHFGSKWEIFQRRKNQYDPKGILSAGQQIFNHDKVFQSYQFPI